MTDTITIKDYIKNTDADSMKEFHGLIDDHRKETKTDTLTKRDIARFIGGRFSKYGTMMITEGACIQFGYPLANTMKHKILGKTAVCIAALAISMKTSEYGQKLGEELVDDVCDCVVIIDDYVQQGKKSREKAKSALKEAEEELES